MTVARKGSCGPTRPKEVDLAPHPVVGRVVQVGNTEKFRKPGSFFFPESASRVNVSAIEEDGGDKRLVELELACEADGFTPHADPV